MSDHTKIQWCHSTVNPIMGCAGCELFPPPGTVFELIDTALAGLGGWPAGKSRATYRELIRTASEWTPESLEGYSKSISTTNIWHLRGEFLGRVNAELGTAAARAAEAAIGRHISKKYFR